MATLTSTVLLIAASGAFGGIIVGISVRTSHKLRLPIFGRLVEIGFLGDALVGAGASVAVFLMAAPLLNITLAGDRTQDELMRIVSLGVVSGLAGMKFLTSTSSHVIERIALLDDRLERAEKGERSAELVRRADALVADNRLEHALATYDEALNINPRSESALIGKAKVYGQRSQWSKAISTASRALELNPSSKRAYYHRACYKNMAATYPKEDVLQDLKSAISLDPHYKNFAKLHDKHFDSLRDDDGFRQLVE